MPDSNKPASADAPEQQYTLDERVARLEADMKQQKAATNTLNTQMAAMDTRVDKLEAAPVTPPVEPPVEPPPGGTDQTLQQLVGNGGAVKLPKGAYKEFCTITKPTQITGMPTAISVEGIVIANQKGIFDAHSNLEVSDLVLKGARVPDRNGAAIRGAIGAAITMNACEVTGCQMGILVAGGGANIVIKNCNFHDNGTGGTSGGLGHEIYCSAVNKTQYGETDFTITDSDVICGSLSCHAIKVRATRTNVKNCTVKGSTSTVSGIAGSVVDLPDGGDVVIEDTEIELRSTSPTSTIMGYMTENTNQGVGTVTLRRVRIVDGRGRGGDIWCRAGVGGKLVLENCTYTAAVAPKLIGWGNVTGAFTKA